MRTVITTLAKTSLVAAFGYMLYDLNRRVQHQYDYAETILGTLMLVHDLDAIENEQAGISIYTPEARQEKMMGEFREKLDDLPTAEGHDE